VIQWTWLEACFPGLDQFNSIHERLIAAWRELAHYLDGDCVHFGHVDEIEDEMTVGYLRDTAEQARLLTVGIRMEDIGWESRSGRFLDAERRPIRTLFKLYPWEGLLGDRFAPFIPEARGTSWMEPAWKMVLSSKGILPILWDLFPDHPNLLPASLDPEHSALRSGWVRKPLHGREGSNVTIEAPGVSVSTGGPYDADRFVYQAYVDMGEYAGFRPMLGSWLIAGEPAGVGIRETRGHVTNNTASFVPHVVR
jgi:glutathionylspermidine synthase